MEDGYHAVAHLQGFTSEGVVAGDQHLMQLSRDLMPRLPVDEIDVLIIDEIGKDISGRRLGYQYRRALDGRWRTGTRITQHQAHRPFSISRRHHTATPTGYGIADFMSRRLFDKIDFPITTKNMFTSGFLQRARMPLVFESDEETIQAALFDAFRSDPAQSRNARVARIKNTMELGDLWVSANIAAELNDKDNVSVGETASSLAFAAGALV